MIDQIKWILKDGAKTYDCTSFPFAYRTMYNILRQGVEKGVRKHDEMVKGFAIISPMTDRSTGKPKVYSFAEATQFAKDTGVLQPDGQINSREFKKKY